MKKNTSKHNSPGRPKYTPIFPRTKEWTFTDLMEVNGIDTNSDHKNFGKGPDCTMLTLRKFMARDSKKLGRSMIFKVRGVTCEPNSNTGLGRRAYLYSLRANAAVKRAAAAPSTPRKAKSVEANGTPATDVSDATKQYEDLKNSLLAPSPVLVAPVLEPAIIEPATVIPEAVIIPAVTIAPEAPIPAPAPVVPEAPAPVAEVAPEVAAPVTV